MAVVARLLGPSQPACLPLPWAASLGQELAEVQCPETCGVHHRQMGSLLFSEKPAQAREACLERNGF